VYNVPRLEATSVSTAKISQATTVLSYPKEKQCTILAQCFSTCSPQTIAGSWFNYVSL